MYRNYARVQVRPVVVASRRDRSCVEHAGAPSEPAEHLGRFSASFATIPSASPGRKTPCKVPWGPHMQDIRVDEDGRNRCWNCGGSGFTEGRTTRAKLAVGVGAFLTKKKQRCTRCGEWNDVGSAKPYTGPASSKYRKLEQRSTPTTRSASPAPREHASAPQLWKCGAGHENHPTRTTCGVCGALQPDHSGSQPTASPMLMTSLERLAELRRDGLLTDKEFSAAKAKLLGL